MKDKRQIILENLRKLYFKYFITHEFKNKLKESFQGTALIHSPSAFVAAIPPL
jgi:hypothetical protein